MTGRRKIGLAAVALGLVAVVVAALLIVDRSRPLPRTAVLGDSVTSLSATEIREALGGEDRVDLAGLFGYRTDSMLETAHRIIGEADPPAALVLTGHNDVTQEIDTDDAVVEVMDLLAGVDCGIWLLMPTKGKWDVERALAFNQRAEALAEDRGVEVETAWRDAVDDTDGPQPDPTLITDDLVHPTDAGSARLAEVMADAVRTRCR